MYLLPYVTLCVSVTLASWIQPWGWLDRLVQHHKAKFLNEINEVTPVKIKATVVAKEPGYVDSSDWDFDSVVRLLNLIRESEDAGPVKLALRRMLRPTRRFMSKALSYKYFPSLAKDSKNDFYYDVDSDEMYIEDDNTTSSSTSSIVNDDAIIIISNPVESRLPSSQISVQLLKQILENRAKAARQMPSTKTSSTKSRNSTNSTTTSVPTSSTDSTLANTSEETGVEDTVTPDNNPTT